MVVVISGLFVIKRGESHCFAFRTAVQFFFDSTAVGVEQMVEKRVVQLSEHKFDAAVDQRNEDSSFALLCWRRRTGRTGRFTFDVTESISTRMY